MELYYEAVVELNLESCTQNKGAQNVHPVTKQGVLKMFRDTLLIDEKEELKIFLEPRGSFWNLFASALCPVGRSTCLFSLDLTHGS